MDVKSRTTGSLVAVVMFLIGMAAMVYYGLSLNSLQVLFISGAGLIASAIAGAVLYDFFLEDITDKVSFSLTIAAFIGLFVVFLLPFASTAFGDVMGYGAQTEAPEAEEPAFPSYMRGTVVNTLSSPQTAISDATITYYDVEPEAGVSNTSLYADNTDASGSFMTEIEEDEGTALWATASKSNSDNYYSEKDSGETGATGSGATDLTFGNYGAGLTEVGTFKKSLANIENGSGAAENVSIDGGDIKLDSGAGPYNFDIVIETSASDTAIRNLFMEVEEGSSFDASTMDVEFEIKEEGDPDYGTLTSSIVSGDIVWDSEISEFEIQWTGDLQYRKDIVINVDIEGFTGTSGDVLANFEDVDDLMGAAGIESETGISQESWTIEIT